MTCLRSLLKKLKTNHGNWNVKMVDHDLIFRGNQKLKFYYVGFGILLILGMF